MRIRESSSVLRLLASRGEDDVLKPTERISGSAGLDLVRRDCTQAGSHAICRSCSCPAWPSL